MPLLKQSSTAQPLTFLLISSTDHITGLTGATTTVTLSKNGGDYASPAGAVTEIANGLYKVAGNATDTSTLGPLWLHATATGADPVDLCFDVVAFDPQIATNLGLSGIPTATPGASGGLQICGTNAASTYATLTITGAFSINGTGMVAQTGDSFTLIGATGSGLTSLAPASTALSTVTWTATKAGFIDAAVSSRMATYTQPAGFLAATFPTGTIANTTNITAGTIATVTNLTNAPTAGDFTAAMKTSLSAATPVVTLNASQGNITFSSLNVTNAFAVHGGVNISNSAGVALTITGAGGNTAVNIQATGGGDTIDVGNDGNGADTIAVANAGGNGSFCLNIVNAGGAALELSNEGGGTAFQVDGTFAIGNISISGTSALATESNATSNKDAVITAVGSATTAANNAATAAAAVKVTTDLLATTWTVTNGIAAFTASTLALAPTGSSGTGAYTIVQPVTDGSTPLQNATVSMTLNGVAYTAYTNSSGNATFNLGAGTYTRAAVLNGYQYAGDSKPVTGSATLPTIAMTANTYTPAENPTQSRCYLVCYDAQGAPDPKAHVTFRKQIPGTTGGWTSSPLTVSCDASGNIIDPIDGQQGVLLARNVLHQGWRGTGGSSNAQTAFTPNTDAYLIPALIGVDQ